MTAGPDGDIWFTEFSANKIGKITTGGTFAEYAIPTANSQPGDIAAGPDGNLWFTEYAANKIGKITTGVPSPSTALPRRSLGSVASLWARR